MSTPLLCTLLLLLSAQTCAHEYDVAKDLFSADPVPIAEAGAGAAATDGRRTARGNRL